MHEMHHMESFLPAETVAMIKKYGENLPDDFAIEESMTILFSDMRGFTELAESYGAREVYATINASLHIQTEIITKHGGSINKFLGDGLLACFSGEQRGEQALLCMVELMRELSAREKTSVHLPCRVGFGMHDGRVLLGLLGDQHRKEFTVIGDVANTAARLCGIAQPFQGLVTEACMQIIPNALSDQYCRYLNAIYLKGKRDGMNVFYVDTLIAE
ncbi:MAG: adenylate/guanylate cyclase domain-containing protein [Zetaproteobacteria bacterium]|nr:adenylate/guanylate cyclase domain-containing protein [Zetaproteobacteria bacterium]